MTATLTERLTTHTNEQHAAKIERYRQLVELYAAGDEQDIDLEVAQLLADLRLRPADFDADVAMHKRHELEPIKTVEQHEANTAELTKAARVARDTVTKAEAKLADARQKNHEAQWAIRTASQDWTNRLRDINTNMRLFGPVEHAVASFPGLNTR